MRTYRNLRPNLAARYPRQVICLDSEARIEARRDSDLHHFGLAVASFDRLGPGAEPVHSEQTLELEPTELWRWVDARLGRGRRRTVLFAHNLDYDLRLTQALEQLPALGFELRGCALDSRTAWLRWSRGETTLWLLDSMAFFPHTLAKIGSALGLRKYPLPARDAPESEWAAYCARDVEILREAVLRLLAWLEQEDAGEFRLTGAAQADAHFRHRFLNGKRLLVHADEQALAAERCAAWTGRCEAWRHGQLAGPLYEYDLALAYAGIARDVSLPARYRGSIQRSKLRMFEPGNPDQRTLHECTVETEAPSVPMLHEGRIVWPVGRFETTLWDCELRLALEQGARVELGRSYLYSAEPVLREWAEWVIGRLDKRSGEQDELIRLLLKHWSRALIGRFALRYPVWEQFAHAEQSAIAWMPVYHTEDERLTAWLQIGREIKEQIGWREVSNSLPQVMSCIWAEARVKLWRLMQTAGFGHLVYCDTDSLIVDRQGREQLAPLTDGSDPTRLRYQRSYSQLWLGGPRQLVGSNERKVAGLPRSARQTSTQSFAVERWEGLRSALASGRPDSVLVRRHKLRLRATDYRRRHLADGRTAPIRVLP